MSGLNAAGGAGGGTAGGGLSRPNTSASIGTLHTGHAESLRGPRRCCRKQTVWKMWLQVFSSTFSMSASTESSPPGVPPVGPDRGSRQIAHVASSTQSSPRFRSAGMLGLFNASRWLSKGASTLAFFAGGVQGRHRGDSRRLRRDRSGSCSGAMFALPAACPE